MFDTAYDTTICKKIKSKELGGILLRAHITDPFPTPREGIGRGETNILLVTPEERNDDIPAFMEPVVVEDLNHVRKVVVDIRPFSSIARGTGDYRITSYNDYTTAMMRAVFQDRLNAGSIYTFASQMPFAWRIFDRWVTGAIVNRMNLRNDLDVQIRLSIISAIYFQLLFFNKPEEALTTDRDVIQYKAASMTNTNLDLVGEVLDKIERLNTIEDYCNVVATATGSIRLDNFKFVGLFNMISNSWFGVNSREIVGVALEHIPTFYSLIYAALTDRSYRRSMLGKVVDGIRDKAAEERFTFAMKDLLLEK